MDFDKGKDRKKYLRKQLGKLKQKGLSVSFSYFRPQITVEFRDGDPNPIITKRTLRYFRSNRSKKKFSPWSPMARGGATSCVIYKGDDIVGSYREVCSDDENFCYDKGKCEVLKKLLRKMRGGEKGKEEEKEEVKRQYWWGSIFQVGTGSYILSSVGVRGAVLVNLNSGMRWSVPVKCNEFGHVSKSEIDELVGRSWKFLANSLEELYELKS